VSHDHSARQTASRNLYPALSSTASGPLCLGDPASGCFYETQAVTATGPRPLRGSHARGFGGELSREKARTDVVDAPVEHHYK
jgi:hypothetical protein